MRSKTRRPIPKPSDYLEPEKGSQMEQKAFETYNGITVVVVIRGYTRIAESFHYLIDAMNYAHKIISAVGEKNIVSIRIETNVTIPIGGLIS